MLVSSGTPIIRTRLPKSTEYSAFSAKDFRAYGHIHIAGRLAQLGLDSLYCRRVFARSCIDRTRGNSMKLAKTHVYSARDSNFVLQPCD